MYLRNYKGKIVLLDEKKYTNEKDLYIAIWKIKVRSFLYNYADTYKSIK